MESMSSRKQILKCYECGGSGKCTECEGSQACTECDGTGECPECADREECSHCGGTEECSECRGSGRCPECEGEGCSWCEEPGICSECDGTGECPHCFDPADCPHCGGTETCPDCEGTSKCPDCEGTGECYECEGTGEVVTDLVNFFDILSRVSPMLGKQGVLDKRRIYFSLRYFEAYLNLLEDFLVKEAVIIREYHEDNDSLVSNQVIELYLENLKYYFPNLLRKSFFTATYSLLEVGLKDTCERLQKRKKLPAKNFEEMGIGRTKKYLETAGINFPTSSPEWLKIENYRQLRNLIVHTQGRLSSTVDPDLKKYIRQHQYLNIKSKEIILQRGFCNEVITTIRNFFKELEVAVKPVKAKNGSR